MQYPQNSSSTSSYVPTKSSKPYPKTSLPSSIDNHNLSSSYHSDNSNSLSSFTSNDCSHQSSLHQDHKTKTYFQKELLFDPIYNNRPSITIPPPTHTPLLQYPISYPYLNVNNIISNTNISHSVSTSFSSQNCGTILDQPNHQSSSNTSQSYSSQRLPSTLPFPSPSFHEPNKTNKQYHETKVQKVRLYHPLRHQQGVWSYSRFHQYCTNYPGVSSNDSNSSLSSDNQSEDDSSFSNPYISCSETPVMICLPINKKKNTTVSQYRNSFLSSSHLKLLFTQVNSNSITQSPCIPSLHNSPTTSSKIFQNETKMSTNKPSTTQSKNIPSPPVDITFGDELIPKQNKTK